MILWSCLFFGQICSSLVMWRLLRVYCFMGGEIMHFVRNKPYNMVKTMLRSKNMTMCGSS